MLKRQGKGPKMKSITMRIARKADFDQLCVLFNESHALHHKALPHFFIIPGEIVYKKSFFQKAFNQNGEVILVTELEGKIIGAVYAKIHEEKHKHNPQIVKSRRYGLITTLVVHKSARNHGLGHQLLAAAEEWLKEKGMEEVRLLVWAFNHEAEQMYKKMGYQYLSHRMYKNLN